MHRRLAFVIVPLIAIIMLAALAPGPVVLTAQANKTVAVIDSTFQPASLSIAAGTTVTWASSGATPHSSTSDDADWDSGQLSSQQFTRTFTAPGSYAYHCTFHPQTMRGTITVVAPSYLPLVLGPNTAAQASPTTTVQPSATATTKPSPTSTVQPSATATTKPSPTSTIYPSTTATGTSTPTATGTSTPTATGTSTPTATESAPSQYGIRGQVQVRPRSATITVQGPPIMYEIVLDASGSMSWNMAGQAGSASSPIQCVPPNPSCSGQVWQPVEERRIYIVKQALNGLIDQMGPNDVMRITAFRGELTSSPYTNWYAISALTRTLPSSWSSDKTVLKNAVSASGAVNNEPYRTSGRAAPSAAGLAAAAEVLYSAPTTAPNGLAYQRNVIFLTDSVANVFRNGKYNFASDNCSQLSTTVSSETAYCHIGNTASGQARPLSALLYEADTLRQYAQVYAVALAGVDDTGLSSIPSGPNAPFYSTAQSSGEVSDVLTDILADITYDSIVTCEPAGGDQWVSQIDAQHTAAFPPPDTLPNGVFGYVSLYDENGVALPAGQDKLPIVHDPGSGLLTFELPASPGLAPGTYQLSAFAGYKGQDSASRIYNGIFNPNTETTDTGQSFTVDPSGAIGSVLVMDSLHLDLIGEVCP